MFKKILLCLLAVLLFLSGCQKKVDLPSYEVAPPPDISSSTIEEADISKYDGDKAKLRAMSYNLMPQSDKQPVYERIPRLNELLEEYKPDIVATAEADAHWRGLLQSTQLGPVDRYAYAFKGMGGDKGHISSLGILYNRHRFTLLNSDAHFFDDYNDTEFHPGFYIGVFWAHFKDNITGKEFIATTTHWQFNSGKEPNWANTTRTYQAKETANLINSLTKKYNCPVIAMGDFNCYSVKDEEWYLDYMKKYNIKTTDFGDKYCMIPFEEKTGLISAKFYEGVKIGNTNEWPTIDNVYIHPDYFKAVYFENYSKANSDYGGIISDHCPVYADLVYKY